MRETYLFSFTRHYSFLDTVSIIKTARAEKDMKNIWSNYQI